MYFRQSAAARRTDDHVPTGKKDPLWKKLAKRLKKTREAAAISQRQLAVRAGFTNATVSRLEGGNHNAGIDTIERIACALGISACWLAFGYEGQELFLPRRPRSPVPHDYPSPGPAVEFAGLYQGFPERMRHARQVAKKSMRTVALETGLSTETILSTENGDQVPRIETLELLAKALNVSPCWLAYGYPIVAGPRSRRARVA